MRQGLFTIFVIPGRARAIAMREGKGNQDIASGRAFADRPGSPSLARA